MTCARKVGKSFGWFLFSERCKHVLEEARGFFCFKLDFRVRRADPLGGHIEGGEVIKLYVFSQANYCQVVEDMAFT